MSGPHILLGKCCLECDHVLVDAVYACVDRTRFIVLHQPGLILLKMLHRDIAEQGVIMPDRCEIRVNGIFSGTALLEKVAEIL